MTSVATPATTFYKGKAGEKARENFEFPSWGGALARINKCCLRMEE